MRSLGYRIRSGRVLRASSSSGIIRVDGSGLASSARDMLDPLAPIVPQLLEAKKEEIPATELAAMYFDVKRRGRSVQLRLSFRGESLGLWRQLRATGESLTTPDEAAVLRFLLNKAKGPVEAVTDYPTEESEVMQIGSKLYYSSIIDVAEFASNLRTTEVRRARNVYVPSNATLQFERLRAPSRAEISKVLGDLGEWCYFSPT